MRTPSRTDLLKVVCLFLVAIIWAVVFYGVITAAARAATVPLADGVAIVERDSNPARLYGTNGANLFMNTGAIIGVRDIQMGWWGDGSVPSLVNGDIGAGSTEHPGILNLGADVSRTVRLQAQGRTVLQTQPDGVQVHGRLEVCTDACRPVAAAAAPAPRVSLLERRVKRLRKYIRRLLNG